MLNGLFCSAHMAVIIGIIIVIVAVAFMKQPRNIIGTAIPHIILKSEAPGLIKALLRLVMILVFPIAAPTTNMEAIITTELFSRPPHASLNPRTPVISRAMGIIIAATCILTLPERIKITNSKKIPRTIAICVVIFQFPFF